MADHSVNSQASPEATEQAHNMWRQFTKGATYSTIAVLGIVTLMALFLL